MELPKGGKSPKGSFTVVFLGEEHPPRRLMMLRRAATKAFAPGWYTGIGGRVEEGETIPDGALRELQEETGLSGIDLTPFGAVSVNNGIIVVVYFFALYPGGALPSCNEGELEWVETEALPDAPPLIPTTHLLVKEWKRRGWALMPFSIEVKREVDQDAFSRMTSTQVIEGLDLNRGGSGV